VSFDLYRLTRTDLERGTKLLVRAFHDDSLTLYFIPPCANWEELATQYFAFRLRFGIMNGEVYATSPEMEGLAAWFAPGRSDLTTFRLMIAGGISLFRYMGGDAISRMNMVGMYASKLRNLHVQGPHWHLFPIAVDPEFQGKGYSSALMRPMLARINQEGLPCYLETQNEKNVPLYEHFGFKVVYIEVIPGIDIKLCGMVKFP
jgi:ribosomal protein S18 acetylase RimI-like enzyme